MRGKTGSDDYVIRVHDHPGAIAASDWDGLLATQAAPTPFLRHAYLLALHESGSAVPATGWTPQFLTLHRDGALVAACALYLKAHSYGEYVFDWAWAEAWERHGRPYYPKLLGAVPFTPAPGTRLMARDAAARVRLLEAVQALAREARLSSAHLLFLDAPDLDAARRAGWLGRSALQFHWSNRRPTPWADFGDFLASLQRDKRKKILQERRRVAEAGVTFALRQGREIEPADWDHFYRCYVGTYRAHRSTPYLTRDFFARMAAALPEAWLMLTAWRAGRRIAAALLAVDAPRGLAWGRYWGATEPLPCLHFEACYYQPLAWCIAQGYARFEGGAQGEHKMARGLLPVRTWSAHWIADPRFARAVAEHLARESAGLDVWVDELQEHEPYRRGDRAPGPPAPRSRA